MAKIIDGKEIQAKILSLAQLEVEKLKSEGLVPCLAVIIVGNSPASRVYVNNKKKACEKIGIRSLEFALPENTTMSELLSLIDELNSNNEVNGILCQLPLPQGLDEKAVIAAINPLKDVDCFHPENVGRISSGTYTLLPCTPAGVMELLRYSNIEIEGKSCVIIGRSNIVGKPMAMLMLNAGATVTVCHSRTADLKAHTQGADIVIAAVGRPAFVSEDMIKPGAVVIDVGINRSAQGVLCGDVDFEGVSQKASYITPVPGGVGPMTIAMLMQNTIKATKVQNKLS